MEWPCAALGVSRGAFYAWLERRVADFTRIRSHEGWLYVAVVLDLCSSRAVGWSMQSSMTAQLVTETPLMAIRRRG